LCTITHRNILAKEGVSRAAVGSTSVAVSDLNSRRKKFGRGRGTKIVYKKTISDVALDVYIIILGKHIIEFMNFQPLFRRIFAAVFRK
jgi:hypothetical protein